MLRIFAPGNFAGSIVLGILCLISNLQAESNTLVQLDTDQMRFSVATVEDPQAGVRIVIPNGACFRKDIFLLENPTRLVVDNPDIPALYSKEFRNFHSAIVREVRVGRHPSKTRLVVEFVQGISVTFSSDTLAGGCEVTCLVSNNPSLATPVVSQNEAPSGIESTYQMGISNRFSGDTSTRPGESSRNNHLLLTPRVELETEELFSAVVSARLDGYYENADDSISEFRVYTDDLYANFVSEKIAFKLGNQRIRWGKTDEVSPLDNVSPEDLQDGFVRRRDDRKIPVPAANLIYYTTSLELQGIFIPWFEPSILPENNSDWSGIRELSQNALIEREDASKRLDDAEFGFQVSGTATDFDYAFNFLSTTSDQPSLHFSGVTPDQVPVYELQYHRREIAGASFETAGELLGFRGDFAFSNGKYFQTVDLDAIASDSAEFVLGADYTDEESLYVNIQLGGEYILEYEDTIAGLDRFSPSMYGEISNGIWESYLTAGTRSFYNFASQDFFLNPYLILTYWDWGSFELGVNILDGNAGALGQVKENDQVYLLAECTL